MKDFQIEREPLLKIKKLLLISLLIKFKRNLVNQALFNPRKNLKVNPYLYKVKKYILKIFKEHKVLKYKIMFKHINIDQITMHFKQHELNKQLVIIILRFKIMVMFNITN